MPKASDVGALARHLRVDVRDAEVLLAAAMRKNQTWILAHPEAEVSPSIAHRVTEQLVKRAQGYPLAYLLEEQIFFGLSFRVTPAVLIPRPETELVVEEALRRIPPRSAFRVADIGTGSGNIAVSLAVHRAKLRVIAVDPSTRALGVARANARRNRVRGRIRFVHGSLLAPLSRVAIDGVVANLPYLPAGPLPAFEPRAALTGGKDGLQYLRKLLLQVHKRLKAPRFVILEIDPRNLKKIRPLIPQRYRFSVLKDLSGRNRVLVLER